MNTFGNLFRITSFGESHGEMMGVVIDGCPPNLRLNKKCVQAELDKRKPGQSSCTTNRKESDQCEIVSGIFEGKTTGAPIAVLVANKDMHSSDYEKLKDVYRPSHADFSYAQKYGIRDHRGGGRSSGRETISRVIGGAVAKEILKQHNVEIIGFARAIGGETFENVDESFIEKNPLRMADEKAFEKTLTHIKSVKANGDSLGGIVEVRVHNVPAGLGAPVFDKLEADLAKACMSVGAVKGFEIGEGFSLSSKKGSEANDPLGPDPFGVRTRRNANGGILGGISTGEDIWFRVAVKPTSSIAKPQKTVNSKGEEVDLKIKGRHDPIIVPRVIPVLEAMTALVLVDHLLMQFSISNFQIKKMSKLKLVLPSEKYKESFLEAQKEFQEDSSWYKKETINTFDDVGKHVQKMKDYSEGKNLPEGWVPCTNFWLIDNNEFIGTISVRHSLTDFLLRLGGHVGYSIRPSKRQQGYGKQMLSLFRAKAKGMKFPKILITCDDENIGSQKMIESCGGVMEDKVQRKDDEIKGYSAGWTRRYWISL